MVMAGQNTMAQEEAEADTAVVLEMAAWQTRNLKDCLLTASGTVIARPVYLPSISR